ncbi:hypothetical protein TNCV_2273421 [Trichonephila clavipes]|nr:hypothetical protein TNCV_2273421 [Trichonephila clavipes]
MTSRNRAIRKWIVSAILRDELTRMYPLRMIVGSSGHRAASATEVRAAVASAYWRTEWRSIVYSDETRFCLGASDGHALVKSRGTGNICKNAVCDPDTMGLHLEHSLVYPKQLTFHDGRETLCLLENRRERDFWRRGSLLILHDIVYMPVHVCSQEIHRKLSVIANKICKLLSGFFATTSGLNLQVSSTPLDHGSKLRSPSPKALV